jgi:predicted HTH domain antitoxin
MTIDELLVFIYFTYEKFAEQSEVKDEIERKKVDASISLFKRHKISLKCAANIAKMPLQQYITLLQNLKIPVYEYTDEELREELASRGADSSQHISH